MTAGPVTAEAAPATDVRAVGAALVTVVLWASAFVGIRSAGTSFSPGALSLGRLSVAIVAMGVLGIAQGERLPSRLQLRVAGPALLLCGLLWFGAYNIALNSGERRVDAVAFAGVVVIAIASSGRAATTTGVLFCLAAAFAYAAAVVAQKVVLRTLSGTQTCGPARGDHVPRASDLDPARLAVARGEPAALAYLGGALCLLGVGFSRRSSSAGRRRSAAGRFGSRP